MRDFKHFMKEKKDSDDPCWKGYRQYGTKTKNGKEVPNCVPEADESEDDDQTENNKEKQ